MSVKLLSRVCVGDTAVHYIYNDASGQVELCLLPTDVPLTLPEESERLVPPAFVHFAGDAAGSGYAGGRTMGYSATSDAFKYHAQSVEANRIRTELVHPDGLTLVHELSWEGDFPAFRSRCILTNVSAPTRRVEHLESFNLGGIGREVDDDAFAQLRLHRFRSTWANEALHDCVTAAAWQLERYIYTTRSERYGQVGTHPVRGFHPFGAVEDAARGIVWGAQLAWSGSWQMEFSNKNSRGLTFGGGLADFEFGHWAKNLRQGESLETPTAFVACVRGDFDALCARLVRAVEATLPAFDGEEELPVVCNEWQTGHENPTEELMRRLADRVAGLPGLRYLVMDAGWYKPQGESVWNGLGDWQTDGGLFPHGLAAMAAYIRSRGLVPGLWFEAEVVSMNSKAAVEDADALLRRHGALIHAGECRHFWDLNSPCAREILDRRVCGFLRENGFGYVKIDYNETIGVGCDHPDSLGEGLRQHIFGVHWLFRRLAETNPGLVIENCASGGQRLEPAMLALTAMSSFSDASEAPNAAAIAGSLHRLIPARANQIWAVIKKDHDDRKVVFKLTTAMMGRVCLSGDLLDLTARQWALVQEALLFYRRLVPLLKEGDSIFTPPDCMSRKNITGAQSLLRTRRDGRQAAFFVHAFASPPAEVAVALPEGEWREAGRFQLEGTGEFAIAGCRAILRKPADFSGHILLLERAG